MAGGAWRNWCGCYGKGDGEGRWRKYLDVVLCMGTQEVPVYSPTAPPGLPSASLDVDTDAMDRFPAEFLEPHNDILGLKQSFDHMMSSAVESLPGHEQISGGGSRNNYDVPIQNILGLFWGSEQEQAFPEEPPCAPPPTLPNLKDSFGGSIHFPGELLLQDRSDVGNCNCEDKGGVIKSILTLFSGVQPHKVRPSSQQASRGQQASSGGLPPPRVIGKEALKLCLDSPPGSPESVFLEDHYVPAPGALPETPPDPAAVLASFSRRPLNSNATYCTRRDWRKLLAEDAEDEAKRAARKAPPSSLPLIDPRHVQYAAEFYKLSSDELLARRETQQAKPPPSVYSEYPFKYPGDIRQGDAYQAEIPDCDESMDEESRPTGRFDDDEPIWQPDHLEDADVQSYLHSARKIMLNESQTRKYAPDNEVVLKHLLDCNFNTKKALSSLPSPEDIVPWTEEECCSFEQGLSQYGKNFYMIHREKVSHRTVQELVEFFYFWKKTERYMYFRRTNPQRVFSGRRDMYPPTEDLSATPPSGPAATSGGGMGAHSSATSSSSLIGQLGTTSSSSSNLATATGSGCTSIKDARTEDAASCPDSVGSGGSGDMMAFLPAIGLHASSSSASGSSPAPRSSSFTMLSELAFGKTANSSAESADSLEPPAKRVLPPRTS